MSDGKVTYEVRADNSKLSGDLKESNGIVQKGAGVMSGVAKKAAVGLGLALIGGTTAAAKFGAEFETSLANASTLFGDVDVDMTALSDGMLELSNESGIAASSLGDTLYNALSAGVPITEDASEAIAFLEKATKLAKSGFTDVDTAVQATAKTLNAYGLGIEETDRIQKILMQTQNNGITTIGELGSVLSNVTPTASAMNVEFEQIGAALASMTAQGTPAAQATTQLNTLFAELGKQGTKANEALALAAEGTELAGMSFQEMNKAGVPLNKILGLLDKQAKKDGKSLLDMFGSIEAGKAALALTGDNAETFTKNLEEMSTETDVVGDAFDKVSGTSAERFAKMVNELKNVAIELFIALAPVIEAALPILMDLFQQLAPVIAQLIEGVLPPLVELLGLLLPPFMQLVNALLPPLISLFNELMPPILALIDNAIVPLITMLIKVIEVAIVPLGEALSSLGTLFANVMETVLTGLKGTVESIVMVFSGLMDFIKGVFTGDWELAWNGITQIFNGIVSGWVNMIKTPINAMIDLINNFLGNLGSIDIPDWVPNIGGKSINIPLIPKLAKGGLAFGETIATVGDNPNAAADPEVIAPLSKLESMLSFSGSGGGGQVVNIVISDNNINEDLDIDNIGRQITQKMRIEGVL